MSLFMRSARVHLHSESIPESYHFFSHMLSYPPVAGVLSRLMHIFALLQTYTFSLFGAFITDSPLASRYYSNKRSYYYLVGYCDGTASSLAISAGISLSFFGILLIVTVAIYRSFVKMHFIHPLVGATRGLLFLYSPLCVAAPVIAALQSALESDTMVGNDYIVVLMGYVTLLLANLGFAYWVEPLVYSNFSSEYAFVGGDMFIKALLTIVGGVAGSLLGGTEGAALISLILTLIGVYRFYILARHPIIDAAGLFLSLTFAINPGLMWLLTPAELFLADVVLLVGSIVASYVINTKRRLFATKAIVTKQFEGSSNTQLEVMLLSAIAEKLVCPELLDFALEQKGGSPFLYTISVYYSCILGVPNSEKLGAILLNSIMLLKGITWGGGYTSYMVMRYYIQTHGIKCPQKELDSAIAAIETYKYSVSSIGKFNPGRMEDLVAGEQLLQRRLDILQLLYSSDEKVQELVTNSPVSIRVKAHFVSVSRVFLRPQIRLRSIPSHPRRYKLYGAILFLVVACWVGGNVAVMKDIELIEEVRASFNPLPTIYRDLYNLTIIWVNTTASLYKVASGISTEPISYNLSLYEATDKLARGIQQIENSSSLTSVLFAPVVPYYDTYISVAIYVAYVLVDPSSFSINQSTVVMQTFLECFNAVQDYSDAISFPELQGVAYFLACIFTLLALVFSYAFFNKGSFRLSCHLRWLVFWQIMVLFVFNSQVVWQWQLAGVDTAPYMEALKLYKSQALIGIHYAITMHKIIEPGYNYTAFDGINTHIASTHIMVNDDFVTPQSPNTTEDYYSAWNSDILTYYFYYYADKIDSSTIAQQLGLIALEYLPDKLVIPTIEDGAGLGPWNFIFMTPVFVLFVLLHYATSISVYTYRKIYNQTTTAPSPAIETTETLFSECNLTLLITNAEFTVLSFTTTALSEFGYTAKQLIGQNLDIIIPLRSKANSFFARKLSFLMRHLEELSFDDYAINTDGRRYHITVSLISYFGRDYCLFELVDSEEEALLEEKANDEAQLFSRLIQNCYPVNTFPSMLHSKVMKTLHYQTFVYMVILGPTPEYLTPSTNHNVFPYYLSKTVCSYFFLGAEAIESACSFLISGDYSHVASFMCFGGDVDFLVDSISSSDLSIIWPASPMFEEVTLVAKEMGFCSLICSSVFIPTITRLRPTCAPIPHPKYSDYFSIDWLQL